ncbi:MAG: hypothetical protein K2X39_07680, partial [Silvanigrellaceae bacterium]|nr:hypothetical protein [Silvanigrellaceae bacterium]
ALIVRFSDFSNDIHFHILIYLKTIYGIKKTPKKKHNRSNIYERTKKNCIACWVEFVWLQKV